MYALSRHEKIVVVGCRIFSIQILDTNIFTSVLNFTPNSVIFIFLAPSSHPGVKNQKIIVKYLGKPRQGIGNTYSRCGTIRVISIGS